MTGYGIKFRLGDLEAYAGKSCWGVADKAGLPALGPEQAAWAESVRKRAARVACRVDGVEVGLVALRDLLQAAAQPVFSELRACGEVLWMGTGDHAATAAAVAAELGFSFANVVAGAVPADKSGS